MSNQKIRVDVPGDNFGYTDFHPIAHINFLTQEETFGALIQDVSTYAEESLDPLGNTVPEDSIGKVEIKIQELGTDKLIHQVEINQYGAEGAVFVPLPEAAAGIVCTCAFTSSNGLRSENLHVVNGTKYASGQQVNLLNPVISTRYYKNYTDLDTFLGLS